MTRNDQERKRDVIAVLEAQGQMWLTTAHDGRPHAIGVSAWWDGADLVVTTVGTSRTAMNLREARTATLVAGTPDDAVVIAADLVESMPAAGADQVATGFSTALGWDPREVGDGWDFFRLRPSRIQAFRGYEEIEGREVMRRGRWLA
jgi:Pyridoxamine 5'-phosphate oxidase